MPSGEREKREPLVYDLVVRNGTLVIPRLGLVEADIAISDQKIAAIGKSLQGTGGAKAIDVRGKVVFPGMVDAHSHFGIYRPLEDDARSESRAAVTGGITTVVNIIRPRPYYLNMTGPLMDNLKALLSKSRKSFIPDYGYTLGPVQRSHLGEIESLAEAGVSEFKFWMHYRDFKFSEEPYDSGFLRDLMQTIATVNKRKGRSIRLSIHCEDPEIIRATGQTGYGLRQGEGGHERDSDPLEAYYEARPPVVEAMAVNRAIQLAYYTRCPINILHITSRLAMEAAVRAPTVCPGVDVTREVVVHHLLLTTESKAGILAKVNPPIRHTSDVDAMWHAVEDGSVDVIGSDHATTPLKMKEGGVWKAIFGFGGNTLVMPVVISEGFHRRGVSLTRIAELLALNPARIHGLWPRKGDIAIGADADLAVVDLKKSQKVTASILNSAQEYTPFEGVQVKGWPVLTVSRGEVVFEDGRVVGKPGHGKFIKRPVTS